VYKLPAAWEGADGSRMGVEKIDRIGRSCGLPKQAAGMLKKHATHSLLKLAVHAAPGTRAV
jgi:hypothetical protein